MYKVLVVDDEVWVRKGIIHKLQKTEYSFTWIKEANDGKVALELVEEDIPDIVITDIRMDHIDGISFVKEIRNKNLDIRFMIISGHADFEYAEEAINLGVIAYLLKPINDVKFTDAFAKLCKLVQQDKNINTTQEKQIKLNTYLIMEKMINRALFENSDKENHQIINEAIVSINDQDANLKERFLYLLGSTNAYFLLIINIDKSNYDSTRFYYHDSELLKFSLINIIEDLLIGSNYITGNNYRDQSQLFLLHTVEELNKINSNVEEFTFKLFATINQVLKIKVTIGISMVNYKLTDELYKQAKQALDLRFVKGNNNVFYARDIVIASKLALPIEQLQLLNQALELGDYKNIDILYKELFSKKKQISTVIEYKILYVEVIRILMKFAAKNDYHSIQLNDYDFLNIEVFNYFSNTDEIIQYLYTTTLTLINNKQDVNNNCIDIIYHVHRYVTEHFNENITLKDISRKFAINSNYLSSLFKQEIGISFNKLIHQFRMEKAVQLLKIDHLVVSDIAQAVGYEDVQYFYRKFKQMYGVTPIEYRRDHSA